MAETELHGEIMTKDRDVLVDWYAEDPKVYVWGNLLIFYEEGNPHKHLAPDIFVVRGVSKLPRRDHYLIWIEGKAPDAVIEITSKKTWKDDLEKKFRIYQDIWKVKEYFLFDPRAEYLDPPLHGYRLHGGRFVRVKPVNGRLPSKILALHLEQDGQRLRFWNPQTGKWLLTRQEKLAQAEAEIKRLRHELEAARGEKP
jgi:Uma2 family endonuclease